MEEVKPVEEEKKVFNIEEVEIFETGKWNGDNYTEKDLDEMVESFETTREALKPHVKLGHSNNQALLQKDGYPSAGWITGLKRKGKKLIAKIENIPEKIYNLIQSKAYGRISSEIFWNLKLNGKTHRRALKAIALLGANTPEVHSLDDFINLYTENFDGELKYYDNIDKETKMDDNKVQELEAQLKEYQIKLSDIEKQNSDIIKENAELKEYSGKVENEKKLSEIKAYMKSQVEVGNITPAQVDYFVALCLDDKEVKSYTNEDNQKIEGLAFQMCKSIIESGKPVVNLTEQSNNVQPETRSYVAKNDDDELHGKIKKYMKEFKVDYNEAFDAISYEGAE